jgi:Zn-dependent protease
MTTTQILYAILDLALIIPAIILHEVSHGYVAYLLGDPTAKNAGRLTLNPLAHVDIWGTVLLPLLMFLTTGFAFGYAKPVPINPYLMNRVGYRNGMLITGAAGPVTNICLAVVSALAFRLLAVLNAPVIVLYIFEFFTLINLVLAFFNLIPIPPLDGSRVVQRFLSGRALDAYNSVERYGFLIVLAIIWVLPSLNSNLDFLTWYLNATVFPITKVLLGVSVI